MANDSIKLYNYYKRYLWKAQDFETFQNGIMDSMRGGFEGIAAASIVFGGDITPVSGTTVQVSPFIAVGPSGYLHVLNDPVNVEITVPGSNQVRSLLVSRPNIIQGDTITRPTLPLDPVPLTQQQSIEVLEVMGTAAAVPAYPAKGSDDVIICGLRIPSGLTTIADEHVDMEQRDNLGKNSGLHQNIGKYDDKIRPYRVSMTEIAVKPSQSFGENAKTFTYITKGKASKFPKDVSGNFNESDTTVNLETGVVSGGDAQTGSVAVSIPSAGNFKVALLSLKADDKLNVRYGSEGTFAQCFDGIVNQRQSGSGTCPLAADYEKPIALIVLGSSNGSAINSLDFVDARELNGAGDGSAEGYAHSQTLAAGGIGLISNTTVDTRHFKHVEIQFEASTAASGTQIRKGSINLLLDAPSGTAATGVDMSEEYNETEDLELYLDAAITGNDVAINYSNVTNITEFKFSMRVF